MPLLRHLTLSLCLLTIASCDLFPESVSRDDSRIHDLIMAAESVNRVQLGFTLFPLVELFAGNTALDKAMMLPQLRSVSASERKGCGSCEERGGPSLDGGGLHFLRCG